MGWQGSRDGEMVAENDRQCSSYAQYVEGIVVLRHGMLCRRRHRRLTPCPATAVARWFSASLPNTAAAAAQGSADLPCAAPRARP